MDKDRSIKTDSDLVEPKNGDYIILVQRISIILICINNIYAVIFNFYN